MKNTALCVFSVLVLAPAAGCGGGSSVSGEYCGNGRVDNDELCDGVDLNGRSCADLNLGSGELACQSDCTFDVSGCSIQPDCGNNTAEGNEQCDGSDLGGETCQSRGFTDGQLACTGACTFDTSNCEGGGECGNGQVEGSEQCDGADLNSQTCETLGLVDGTLDCDPDCTFNVAGCTGQADCGNGMTEYPETCDGSDLNNETCLTQDFYGGDLACLGDCSDFDTSGCRGHCGDDTINGPEVCDGADLNNQTCQTRGFYTGTLACLTDCSNFDTSGCSEYCGDNQTNGTEVCDGADLNNETCVTQGYYTGNLACQADCSDYNLSNCSGFCGDGIIQSGDGETCDGTNLGGATCESQGMPPGPLGCLHDCTDFDVTRCGATDVIINEINLGVPDWVELLNPTNTAIQLQGWVLEWWGYSGATPVGGQFVLPAYLLAGGGRVLILDENNGSGAPCDNLSINQEIQCHDNINWYGGPEAVALYNDNGDPVDFARWGGTAYGPPAGTSWSDGSGVLSGFSHNYATLSRDPDGYDQDSADDFCVAEPTPNATNGPCLDPILPGTLLITEVDTGQPDWIEIYNPGPGAVNLLGWAFEWSSNSLINDDPQNAWTFLPDHVIGVGQYRVILEDNNMGRWDPGYVDGMGRIRVYSPLWSNTRTGSAHIIEPIYWDGVDFVRWGGSQFNPYSPDTWADTPAALPLIPTGDTLGRRNLTDTNVAGDWCPQNPTQGTANGACQ